MSLPHILLGILSDPISGYDIKKKFDSSLRHFWFAELSQLYPTLKKLVDNGLATVETTSSTKGPSKKVYQRTEAGRDQLIDWIVDTAVDVPIRNPYLGQVFFLGELDEPDRAIQFFTKLKNRFTQNRLSLIAIEQEWKKENPNYPNNLPENEFYAQMTLEFGLDLQQTYENWCTKCITRIVERAKKV